MYGIIGITLFIIIITMLNSRIYINSMVNIVDLKGGKVTISVSIWGICFYKTDSTWTSSLLGQTFSLLEQIEEKFHDEKLKDIPLTKKIYQLQHILKLLRQAIYIHRLNWQTVIGTREANWTACLCGFLWSVKYNILGLFNTNLDGSPSISIDPNFQARTFHTKITSTSSISVYKGIQLFFLLRQIKERKGEK